MIKDLVVLVEELNKKVPTLVEAIKKEDPTTKQYEQLLNNYSGTMQIISALNRTLTEVSLAAKAQEGKEEKENESNN
jgi:hypothetical protein